ncbi:MAG: hypothetical protein WB622_05385 [Acidobacteriaceae bacterium]
MNILRSIPVRLLLSLAFVAVPLRALAQAPAQTTILHATDAAKVLPDAVYFAGKSAGTQLRNSAGVHYADGHYVLAVLVDTSGYSSALQEKYQGYLLSEVPLEFGDHRLPAGAYGIGFVGDHFVVLDISSHELLRAAGSHDQAMTRPTPLQILDGSSAGVYKLCFGRNCVDFHRAQ